MPRIIAPGLALLMLLSSFSAGAKELIFKCNVKNLDGAELLYCRSHGGILVSDYIPATLDADSSFTLSLDGAPVERVNVRLVAKDKTSFKPVYLYNGITEVSVDPRADDAITVVSGMTAADQAAVDEADNVASDFFTLATRRQGPRAVEQDSSAATVYSKLRTYADSVISLLKPASKPLRKALRQDVAVNVMQMYDVCQSISKRMHPASFDESEWADSYRRLKKWADFDEASTALSFYFPRVAQSAFYSSCSGENMVSRDSLPAELTRFYAKEFSGKSAEALIGLAIIKDSDGNFSTLQPELAAGFEAAYPASQLLPLVHKAVALNNKANAAVPNPDIHFIEADDSTSLADVLARFKGRPVVVDLWATWCGPCRKAFAEAPIMQEFARKNGVELLYISIDSPSEAAAVRKLVNFNELKGYHVHAPEKLAKEVFATFSYADGNLAIPHVALYGSDGELLVKRFEESERMPDLVKAIAAKLPARPVKVCGQVKNLGENSARVIAPIACNPDRNSSRYAVELDPEGKFSVEMDLPYAHNFTVYYDRRFYGAYAEPGDSLYFEIDASDLDSAPVFYGDRAAFNNQFSRAYTAMAPTFYNEFSRPDAPLADFLTELYGKVERNDSVIDAYADSMSIEAAVRDLLKREALFTVANAALDYPGRGEVRVKLMSDPIWKLDDSRNAADMMFPYHVSAYVNALEDEVASPEALIDTIAARHPLGIARDIMLLKAAEDGEMTDVARNLFALESVYRLACPAEPEATDVPAVTLPGAIYAFEDGKAVAVPYTDLASLLAKEYAGKTVYLDMWATWCGPCRAELKALPEVARFMTGDDVVFVGVALKSNMKVWPELISGLPANCHNYFVSDDDASELIMTAFSMTGFPSYRLISPDGKVVDANPPRPMSPAIFEYLKSAVKR